MKLIEKIKCPICNFSSFNILRKNQYKNMSKKYLKSIFLSSSDMPIIDQVVKCKKCLLVYLNPRINSKLINKSYKDNKDYIFSKYNAAREKTFYNNIKKFFKYKKIKNLNNKNILDIGCGGGSFLNVIHNLGGKPYGIEPSKWMVKNIKKKNNFNVYAKTIENFNIKIKFDIISLWDVLEHLTNLNKSISAIKKKLVREGLLIVNVPDHGSWQRKLLKFNWPFYLNVHLYYFEKETITKLMKKHGFNLIYENKHYQILPLKYILFIASKIFSFFKFINALIPNQLNFDIKYNIGQKFYVFKKK